MTNWFHDVSIIVVAYENDAKLERCVRSCVAQTYPGRSFEVLIMHEANTPAVEDVVANYGRGQAVAGLVVANDPQAIVAAAIRKCTGRFVLFVHQDDFISDFMILAQTLFLYDNPDYGAVSVDYWLIDSESDRKVARRSGATDQLLEGVMFRKEIMVKLSRSEGAQFTYDPPHLAQVLARNTRIGHIPIAFYRRATRARETQVEAAVGS